MTHDFNKRRKLADELRRLIKESKEDLMTHIPAVKKDLATNEDALEAANDYFAFALASFEDLFPRLHESEYSYHNRVSQRRTELEEREYKLRLELE